MKPTGCLSIACVVSLATGLATQEQEPDRALVLHVAAPSREVALGDGTRARPFATLAHALDAVRRERAAERAGRSTPRRIELRLAPGTFPIDSTVVVDAACSGASREAPTVLVATPPGTRLIGARAVPRHARAELTPRDPRRARLPSDAARLAVRRVDLAALGVDAGPFEPRGMGRPSRPPPAEAVWRGEVLRLARWPNDGFATIGAVTRSGSTDPASDDGATFVAGDARVEGWSASRDVWLHGYWFWDWADATLPLRSVEPLAHTVTLGAGHQYGVREGGRFRVLNALEELDEPGEYQLDTERGELLIWPPLGAEPGDELLVTSLRDALVYVTGAHDVTLLGLEFGPTRGVAVRVEDGERVVVDGCSFTATGSHGLVLRGREHVARRCTFTDQGASGITLDGGDRATLTHGGLVVEDCELLRFARLERTYRPGIAIAGVGHVVRHNRLGEAPHGAILFSGNEHLIEANEIFDVVRETGDAGAIYAGRDWAMHGTVIRHNLIRDVRGTKARNQNGIYLDDMASGIAVTGNLLVRCNLGVLCGGGRDLLVSGNLFADCGEAIHFDARGVGWMAKDLADPETSTLHRRLREIPFDREPWSTRYPQLGKTLTESFGRPLGSAIVLNALFRTPFGRVDDRELVRVEGNRSFERGLEVPRDADASLDVAEIPGFVPVPVGSIGPRR